MHIVPVCVYVIANDELLRAYHIHIVTRLELTIVHMALLHVHEGCVMIRFAIAVPISADVQILRVFLSLFQPYVHRLYSTCI